MLQKVALNPYFQTIYLCQSNKTKSSYSFLKFFVRTKKKVEMDAETRVIISTSWVMHHPLQTAQPSSLLVWTTVTEEKLKTAFFKDLLRPFVDEISLYPLFGIQHNCVPFPHVTSFEHCIMAFIIIWHAI